MLKAVDWENSYRVIALLLNMLLMLFYVSFEDPYIMYTKYSRNITLADLIAILGSIDFVLGSIDLILIPYIWWRTDYENVVNNHNSY